jgi:hypothetical protein
VSTADRGVAGGEFDIVPELEDDDLAMRDQPDRCARSACSGCGTSLGERRAGDRVVAAQGGGERHTAFDRNQPG